MKNFLIFMVVLISTHSMSLFTMENNPNNDTVLDINSLKKRSTKQAVSDDTVENELHDLEQGIDWDKEDVKLVAYFIKKFPNKVSEELQKSFTHQVAFMRVNNYEEYSQWHLKLKLEETDFVTRKKSTKKTVVKKGTKLTVFESLLLQYLQADKELKDKQLQALQETGVEFQLAIKVFNSYWSMGKKGSVIAALVGIVTISVTAYNFLVAQGWI